MDRSKFAASIASSPFPPFPLVQKNDPAVACPIDQTDRGSEARRKIHARASNGQTSFARAAKKYFFAGSLSRNADCKNAREFSTHFTFPRESRPALTLPECILIIAPLSWMARPVFYDKTGELGQGGPSGYCGRIHLFRQRFAIGGPGWLRDRRLTTKSAFGKRSTSSIWSGAIFSFAGRGGASRLSALGTTTRAPACR